MTKRDEPESFDAPTPAEAAPGEADGLAAHLGELARALHAQTTVEATLTEVVQTALTLIPRASAASITLVTGRHRAESVAASGELPRVVDALQTETGQGPCLEAAFRERSVHVSDMGQESRWPKFSHRAWEAGARSMLAIRLFVDGDKLGALNLYGADTGDFGQEWDDVGSLVATHAAVALANARNIRNFKDAVASRDLIGQAKGILMERHKISAQQAFAILATASSTTNRRLADIAEELTLTGTLTTSG